LFHDNPCTESQFRSAAIATKTYNVASARAGALEKAPPKPNLRPIYLDYLVYNRSVKSQLGQSSGSREWDRVAPPSKSETVWKVDLSYYSWANCQTEIIRLCGPTRNHVDDHLRRLQREGLLKWHCILHRDEHFAQKKNYYVTNDEEFVPFVQAVNKSTNKAMIRILMDDPNRTAKDSDEVRLIVFFLMLE
jgi:hypothetical protein